MKLLLKIIFIVLVLSACGGENVEEKTEDNKDSLPPSQDADQTPIDEIPPDAYPAADSSAIPDENQIMDPGDVPKPQPQPSEYDEFPVDSEAAPTDTLH